MKHALNLVVAAVPQGALFLAQTWLMAMGESAAVLALASYSGLIGLVFLAFDGGSGLVPAVMRRRRSMSAIRTAYLAYRGLVILLFAAALPLAWHFAPNEIASLLPFLAGSLLLRLPWLDADLDRRGWHHWSMMLQNGWMVPLALLACMSGEFDATAAGHAALWSTAVLLAVHLIARKREKEEPGEDFRPAIFEILAFMGAQGLGQLYGRAVLFVVGAAFSGPSAALVIYAKQAFNAAGLVVTYLRRIDLAGRQPAMRLSLPGQVAIGLAASLFLALAARQPGLPGGIVLALVGWQVLEKLSANAVYAFQLKTRHGLALNALLAVAGTGLLGLALAVAQAQVLIFVTVEAIAYSGVLLLWLRTKHGPLSVGERAGP